jgi:hypothetical protein
MVFAKKKYPDDWEEKLDMLQENILRMMVNGMIKK